MLQACLNCSITQKDRPDAMMLGHNVGSAIYSGSCSIY